ncbi:MAG: HAMP domain-containing histidine kinase [Bacteroidetes bacterium]|nr:HAMP domain-containing histidine kinase [Bacteroidota bacterium]
MSRKTQKMDKESILVMTALSVFCILIIAVAFMFVRMMDKRNELSMQYIAEQSLLTFFYQASKNQGYTDDMFGESRVIGLGTYDKEGVLIIGLGQVPEVYTSVQKTGELLSRKGKAEYNKETGFIEYTRRAMGAVSIGSEILAVPDLMYIALDGKDYRRTKLVLFGFYGIFSLIIIVIELFAWRMYTRNKKYRETLTKQESLVSLGEAARTLAHEIKNPLSAIALQTAVLKKTMPEEAGTGLKTIEEQVTRLNNLADRVREFIRNGQGNPEHINIVDLITEISKTFDMNIPIETVKMDARFIEIDRERARSAFGNLIKNALESGVDSTPDIYVLCKSSTASISISIVDSGEGLPGGQEKMIFDPFFTTKTQGSGIGLAISRRFVESAGGTLKLRRRELEDSSLFSSKGTIAEVVLPGSRT